MTAVITSQNLTLGEIEDLSGLTITDSPEFFSEWQGDLPDLSWEETQCLDRVKSNYLSRLSATTATRQQSPFWTRH
ncbi:MAG: hypothetical protein HC890_17830 [Chloroflexaceae bacterium]|nr:hypothetical protein [Chloroflexaceae bacterium]